MKSPEATSAEVEIFGSVYPVRGAYDREYLEALAAHVDRTMRQVSQRVASVETGRIAILAALNVADELFQCQKQQEGERVEITDRIAALTGRLEAALGD